MKIQLLALGLLAMGNTCLLAQDRFAYAVTDIQKEGVNWSFLRRLDLQTGQYSDVLLQGNAVNTPAYDAQLRTPITPIRDNTLGALPNAPFVTGVAAIAYDKRHERLFFTPMFYDQLRYIDLRNNQVYFVQQDLPEALKVKSPDQGNIITRMTIAGDGNGYALTNDASQLIRFSTSKKVELTALGGLVDDPANKDISVHNACTSYGGDMVADNNGQLYLFTARNHVFRINPETKLALHLGHIKGLPETFSTNGAAVTADNRVLISSATNNAHLYLVNIDDWTASPAIEGAWRSSDLANSNLLATRPLSNFTGIIGDNNTAHGDGRIRIYPNPAVQQQVQLTFNLEKGNYSVQITDIAGRNTALSIVSVQGAGQTHTVRMPAGTKPGTYLVKVLNAKNSTVFSEKVLLQ